MIVYPALYQSANALSLNAQRNFFWTLKLNLLCLVGASLLPIISGDDFIGYIQAVTLLMSLGCTIYLATIQPQKLWYGGRAVAESVKTITWRYMMRAEPYDSQDHISGQHFAKSLKEILDANRETSKHAISTPNGVEISEEMNQIRSKPIAERVARYASNRIAEQLTWYRKKASINKRNSKLCFALLILINVLAVISSLVNIGKASPVMPTDLFITVAGVIIAWTQAKRHQELSASYALTAHEIGILQTKAIHHATEQDFSLFVSDAENAFSREHTQWLARRDQ